MAKKFAPRQLTLSVGILVICILIAVALSSWKETPEKEREPDPVPLVDSIILEPQSLQLTINSQGVVSPSIETTMVSEVSGVVKSVSTAFVSGGVFKKGDVLARIDDSDYQVSLSQAEASLAASTARLQEESARAEAEKKSWLKSGKKLDAAPALLLRTPYVAEARANVKAAEAQLRKAQRDLERTQIKAPYDGMVKERTLNLGQFVMAGSQAGSIFSVDKAEIRLPVKSSDLAFIAMPAPVKLTQRFGLQEVKWNAELTRAEGVVDDRSRMHYVVAEVTDPYGLNATIPQTPLKSGSFAQAAITGKSLDGLFRLPRNAIYGDGKVLIIDENSTVQFRSINLIYSDNTAVFVNGGLKSGDRICLTPLSLPIEGMKVRIKGELLTAETIDRPDAA
ncbi:efflux RND transporter periplasmic adaptor subunit [Endozoicomonas ascidiicola]|uniref:efflux RND transporter periplasmic adaptor subunit n=1 Tax=Endozoicomonas ascidiicola TaxID=1698521 RepID=UPI0008338A7A|nr:efflux RND transporter periplasmic adaptor subunit [Endozoicomonas ascidiicola]